jgi:hypothetical protein
LADLLDRRGAAERFDEDRQFSVARVTRFDERAIYAPKLLGNLKRFLP